MSSLTNVVLPCAFNCKNDVTITGSTHFIPLSRIDIGALQRFFPEVSERVVNEIKVKREVKPQVIVSKPTISVKNDWDRMDRTIEVMNVSDNSYNGKGLKELDLSGFVNLRELKVGDECFRNVKKVNICGLKELESVYVGNKSFRRDGSIKGGSFSLKNSPKLKELKIGRYSFSDYSVCEIESVDALEVIEMGKLSDWSASFKLASLELKSIISHEE